MRGHRLGCTDLQGKAIIRLQRWIEDGRKRSLSPWRSGVYSPSNLAGPVTDKSTGSGGSDIA